MFLKVTYRSRNRTMDSIADKAKKYTSIIFTKSREGGCGGNKGQHAYDSQQRASRFHHRPRVAKNRLRQRSIWDLYSSDNFLTDTIGYRNQVSSVNMYFTMHFRRTRFVCPSLFVWVWRIYVVSNNEEPGPS